MSRTTNTFKSKDEELATLGIEHCGRDSSQKPTRGREQRPHQALATRRAPEPL